MPKLTIDFTDEEVAGISAASDAANEAMPAQVADKLSMSGTDMIPNPDIYAGWEDYMTRRNHEVAGSYVDQFTPSVEKVLSKLNEKERAAIEAVLPAGAVSIKK